MKRSDAIKAIADIIQACQSAPSTVTTMQISDMILSAMESLGMLPPKVKFNLGKIIVEDHGWDGEDSLLKKEIRDDNKEEEKT